MKTETKIQIEKISAELTEIVIFLTFGHITKGDATAKIGQLADELLEITKGEK